MTWKETLRIIFDESKANTKEEHASAMKSLIIFLYPIGTLGAFVIIWIFGREQMTPLLWVLVVLALFVAPAVGFYRGHKQKLKQIKDR
jgi:hypothetical protein